ncbi:MAG: GTP-binding protein, partial [Anaerolineales bacterium]|nr:GTP-binding protein [Anaerolineales bacterium]
MKDYATGQLRNVVLLGHGGSGKTSLVEAMLLTSGAINRMGRVEDGSTVTDFDQEEIRRQISLSLALAPVEWKDYKINLLDTPGYTDFVGEVKSGIRVADLAVVVVDSVSGVEVGTELVWGYADERSLPRVVVVNKLNRDNANLPHVMESLRATFGDKNFVPLQLPIGNASTFSGVVDLLKMQAFVGSDAKGSPVPAELQDEAQEARVAIIEAAAESN